MGWTPEYPFPDDKTVDGVKYFFTDRMGAAAGHIRDAFAVNDYDSGVSYVGQANEDTQFPLEYRDLSTPRGRILSFGHCTAHGTSEDETSLTTIQTNNARIGTLRTRAVNGRIVLRATTVTCALRITASRRH